MLYVCSLTTPIAAVLLASLPTVTAGQRAAAAAGKKHTARRRRLTQTGADYQGRLRHINDGANAP